MQTRPRGGSTNGARSVNRNLFGSDLRGIRFTSCRFHNCDLSLSNTCDSMMQDAVFSGCKALGERFDHCSRFGFSITLGACLLDNSSFRGMKLKKTGFRDCRLHEAISPNAT
ncbi:MAG: pentapeptide repeat-containing protein [Alistipes sp.]|nr:pentapeptide repeat-containing protein [Alistipes sp.]